MNTKLTVVVLAALVTSAANSEIEKLASPGSKGIDLVWWPKLAVPKGWHRDVNVS